MLTCSWRIRCNSRSSGPSNSPSRIFRSSVSSSETMCGHGAGDVQWSRRLFAVSNTVSGLFSFIVSSQRFARSVNPVRSKTCFSVALAICLRLFTSLGQDRVELVRR